MDAALRKSLSGISGILVTPFDGADNVAPARLAPIVAKLGLKSQRTARKGRKPATKAASRRTARQPAKRVTRKVAR